MPGPAGTIVHVEPLVSDELAAFDAKVARGQAGTGGGVSLSGEGAAVRVADQTFE